MANTIIRWNPLRELSAIDRLFEETWRNGSGFNGGSLPVDVIETDDAYRVVTNIPGVDLDRIAVSLHDNVLSIGVDIPQPELAENTTALVRERFTGKLTRSFSLPQKVDGDATEATYENGVLTLTLPKAADARPRQIQVRRGNQN
jgi:HSP20 family protein